jgi:hypothetical protein
MLEIMSPSLSYAKAANAESDKSNLRLCVLLKGGGVNPTSWDITGSSETNFELSKLLKPLEKNKQDIVVLRNLDADLLAGGGHENSVMYFMTGQPRKSRLVQNQSFDQVVADHVGTKTPLKSLQLRSDPYLDANDPSENFLSYDSSGNALPVEDNPELVFNKLFKGFNNAGHRKSIASVLDEVKGSYQSLSFKASYQDKQVLDQYLQSVREIEKDIEQFKTQENPERAAKLKQIQPIAAATDMPQRTRAMLDLIALAFWTDMTRVSTLMMSHTESRTIYDFIGVNDEMHALSHFVRARNRSAGLSGYDKINIWHTQQFAYFLDKLKSLKDGESSLFDNSIVLFGSDIKHGDYHSICDLPLILAGGGGGQIKLGRYVKYLNTPNCNLHLKIMEMMGVKRQQYGNSTGVLGGISEMANFEPKYVDDGTWDILSDKDGKIEVKGLLTISVKEEDLNLYILQLSKNQSIEIRTSFGNIHDTKLDACVGSLVHLEGQYSVKDGKKMINKVTRCKRL